MVLHEHIGTWALQNVFDIIWTTDIISYCAGVDSESAAGGNGGGRCDDGAGSGNCENNSYSSISVVVLLVGVAMFFLVVEFVGGKNGKMVKR